MQQQEKPLVLAAFAIRGNSMSSNQEHQLKVIESSQPYLVARLDIEKDKHGAHSLQMLNFTTVLTKQGGGVWSS